jgi:hypothetical protein
VQRLETQLIGADNLDVRAAVDGAYEQIVQVMFESLQQMAKMSDIQHSRDGQQEEDKGVLNFHVILIGALCLAPCTLLVRGCVLTTVPDVENMHHFIAEISQQELGAMQGFLRRAQIIYDDNLSAYVKLVMRRPMGKILVCGVLNITSISRVLGEAGSADSVSLVHRSLVGLL